MDDTISNERYEEIWLGLSDVFVDNETNYDFINREVGDVSFTRLKEIFFNDVAPICGINFLVGPVPPVWSGFDKDELAKEIREMHNRINSSALLLIKHKLAVSFYRLRFGYYWKNLVTELEKRRTESGNG
jgi:hypothetical protein